MLYTSPSKPQIIFSSTHGNINIKSSFYGVNVYVKSLDNNNILIDFSKSFMSSDSLVSSVVKVEDVSVFLELLYDKFTDSMNESLISSGLISEEDYRKLKKSDYDFFTGKNHSDFVDIKVESAATRYNGVRYGFNVNRDIKTHHFS